MQHNEPSGVIIIDKPSDISSAAVVAAVKRCFKVRKVGHTGTLDPFATGVLICCINNATRLSRFYLKGHKKYEALLHLGVTTDTQDSTGKIISTCGNINFSEDELKRVFKQFVGRLKQEPPVYSALKHNGVPLYKLARKGCPVKKPARYVFVSSIKILHAELPFIRFEVSCSPGTYIRTLGHDIGSVLGCGGHIKELKRVENSGFSINNAYNLPDIEKKCICVGRDDILSEMLIGMSDSLPDLPCYVADEILVNKIMHGVLLSSDDFKNFSFCNEDAFIKIVDKKNNLLSILEPDDDNTNKFKYCCVFN